MRTLRLCLLILLAVLLPVRGAVAAAMLCPAMGSAPPTASQKYAQPHDHARMLRESHGSSSTSHDHASQCKLCCAFCSLTPMPSGLPAPLAPQHFSAVTFPEPLSPAPSFLSDGQERPPRST